MSETPESDEIWNGEWNHAYLFSRMRKMERERNAYKALLAYFMEIADDFAESRRGQTRFLELADRIEDNYPELATGRFSDSGEEE
jgi:ribosomal protein L17